MPPDDFEPVGFCGDGKVNGVEACDDGNAQDDDECANDCSSCGDGVVQGRESCDNANDVFPDWLASRIAATA